MPVRHLTSRGMAALFMHHPRRKGAGAGIAGRGHGALHSEVDISIEMRYAGDNLASRARRFFCLSRHPDTPRNLLFELNPDASGYTLLPETDDEGLSDPWDVLRMVLDDAPQKLTRLDILDEWPPDFPKPDPSTLWRWLENAVAANLLKTEGDGRKSDPFRYWLPQSEARWRQDPLHDFLDQQSRQLNLPFESLRDKKRKQLSDPNSAP